MAGIKPESGIDYWLWISIYVGAYLSLFLGLATLEWIGIRVPIAQSPILRGLEMIILTTVFFGIGSALLLMVATIIAKIVSAAERLAVSFAENFETFLTDVVEMGQEFLTELIKLAARPLTMALNRAYEAYIAPTLERWRQYQELHRMYEEFRGEYSSFEEFARQFENGGKADEEEAEEESRDSGQKQEQAPPVDKFVAACRTLGMSEDGAFTQAEFKAQYHKLMKAVHPDVIGPNTFATQLNEARDIIKSRKGWK